MASWRSAKPQIEVCRGKLTQSPRQRELLVRSTCPLRTDFGTMEQLLAIALVVGVVVAAALFFMGGGKKKFLDKSR